MQTGSRSTLFPSAHPWSIVPLRGRIDAIINAIPELLLSLMIMFTYFVGLRCAFPSVGSFVHTLLLGSNSALEQKNGRLPEIRRQDSPMDWVSRQVRLHNQKEGSGRRTTKTTQTFRNDINMCKRNTIVYTYTERNEILNKSNNREIFA